MKKYKATVKKYDGPLLFRIEHPEINIRKGEGVTYHFDRKTGEVWIRKNGRLLTFLIFLKGRMKEFLRELLATLMERIERW